MFVAGRRIWTVCDASVLHVGEGKALPLHDKKGASRLLLLLPFFFQYLIIHEEVLLVFYLPQGLPMMSCNDMS